MCIRGLFFQLTCTWSYDLHKAKPNRAETKVHSESSVTSSKFPLIKWATISAISLSRGLCALTIGARRFPFFWRDASRKLPLHFIVELTCIRGFSRIIFQNTLPSFHQHFCYTVPSILTAIPRVSRTRVLDDVVYSSFTRLTIFLSEVKNLYAPFYGSMIWA